MQQTENNVKIEGILSEIDLETGSYVSKSGETVEKIDGSIKIRVTQKLNDEDCVLDIPVYMFANKLKKNGELNPSYTSIEHVMKEYSSIAAVGEENADRVRITNGDIRMNEYYNAAGALVSYPRVHASFISKVTDMAKFKPEATFSAVFLIGHAGFEMDKDGVENPNRYKIRGILPQYGGSVDVIDFYAISPGVINAVSNYWTQGDTVKINGKLNFTSRVEEKQIEVDFGEPRTEKHTITVSELVITGGTQTPLGGDMAIDPVEADAALAERSARLEASKNRTKSKARASASASVATSKPSFADVGF